MPPDLPTPCGPVLPHLTLFRQTKRSSSFSQGGCATPDPPLKSAAVAASDHQLGMLNRSRLLSQPPTTRRLTGHSSDHSRPQTSLDILELFSGPHSGTFFYALFVAFPGTAKNQIIFGVSWKCQKYVRSAGSTLFSAFPGNATKHEQKKVLEGAQKNRNIQDLLGVPGQALAQT